MTRQQFEAFDAEIPLCAGCKARVVRGDRIHGADASQDGRGGP